MNLQNLNVAELSVQELVSVNGGGRIKGIKKVLGWLATAIGLYDAIDDFKEGWNSVDCDCEC